MAEFIKKKVTNHIAYIGLDRGRSNAMHLEMIRELSQEIKTAEEDPSIEAMILHGKESFFSSGLDLITLYDYDEKTIRTFWEEFFDLTYTLASFTKPSVASITGHSPAGGCVLAICCDYRVMAEGDYIIGLNEVPVGLIVPASIFELYSFWIGQAQAYRFLLAGTLHKPNEALSIGLVDEIAPFDRINTIATRKAKTVMQYDNNSWSSTKLNIRKNLLETIKLNKTQSVNQLLEQWWKPSTRNILKTIIENLTQKKV